ncbi:hypothetical protein NL676_035280 [Syzygium grande]|nr:hypothetical protein NL676_035280 [Syzygium grande]
MGTLHIAGLLWVNAFLLFGICMASIQTVGQISPGFQGSQMNWIDHDGLFLLSNDSNFAFGFVANSDVTSFSLAIIHLGTKAVVWSANRDSPVAMSDKFVFDATGNAFLQKGGSVVWSTDSGGKGVSVMELMNSGNLVLLGNNGGVIWQSFSHPTDTLLSEQEFTEGMKLVSQKSQNLSYTLEIKSGDMILSAAYGTPQPYWSMRGDTRRIINNDGTQVTSASLDANSWNFYDQNRSLLWQFVFSTNTDPNATWIAVLRNDGSISFTNLESSSTSPTQIPNDQCGTPEPCNPYMICYSNKMCRCLPPLSSYSNCGSGINSPCDGSAGPVDLISVGDSISYFALNFVSPSLKADLNGCKTSCLANCSCLAMFFQTSSGNCYLFNDVGAFKASESSSRFTAMIKVSSNGGAGATPGGSGSSKKRVILLVVISVVTVLLVFGLVYAGFRWYVSTGKFPGTPEGTSEEDNFLENLAGMPIRFSYRDLQTATDNFTRKLGQEKSDVYSYGMLLLEIIGGRKNYDPSETSEKSHFPSYAFKMMEEGKLRDIVDSSIKFEDKDDRVSVTIKVALWCIQEDMAVRPSMTKVVQMLEGICSVPMPPMSSPLGSRLFPNMFKSISEEGTSSGPSDCNSDAHLSAVRLSACTGSKVRLDVNASEMKSSTFTTPSSASSAILPRPASRAPLAHCSSRGSHPVALVNSPFPSGSSITSSPTPRLYFLACAHDEGVVHRDARDGVHALRLQLRRLPGNPGSRLYVHVRVTQAVQLGLETRKRARQEEIRDRWKQEGGREGGRAWELDIFF